jgi:DNA-binding response OmpR family regulator
VRALLASKDEQRANQLTQLLGDQNLQLDAIKSADGAKRAADEESYCLFIVDHEVDGVDGRDIVQQLRQAGHGTPIVLLTNDHDHQFMIDALDLGADEVVKWPIVDTVLLAQIRSLLRRCEPGESARLTYNDLSLDLRSLEVIRGDTPIPCTSREIAVLEYLLRHPERVVSRTELIDAVWDHELPPESNVVEVFIARLRRKLDRPFEAPLIHTIVGRGYMLSLTRPGVRAQEPAGSPESDANAAAERQNAPKN